VGKSSPAADARDRVTAAALVVVSFKTPAIDLRWVPTETQVVVVCNDQCRPSVHGAAAVEFIEPDINLGFGAAVNLGVRRCTASRVVVANPDCELLAAHWEVLASGSVEEVTLVPLQEPDGTASIVVSRYPTRTGLAMSALRARHRLRRCGWRLDPQAQAPGSYPLSSHWFSGAAFSIDRQRFLDVGGFDQEYFLYWEDADLARRLGLAFADMEARLADAPLATHSVGSSSVGSRSVATERLLSAARFARSSQGLGWSTLARNIERYAQRPGRARRQQPGTTDLVVLTLGRASANGERRRVRTWREIAESADITVRELTLDRRRPIHPSQLRDAVLVLRGELVPEALLTRPLQCLGDLHAHGAVGIVCVTARAYHPRLADLGIPVVLDYVDRLSDSYSNRATSGAASKPTAWTLRALSFFHRRFESRAHPSAYACAAGRSDASALSAEFVPIVASQVSPAARAVPCTDMLFVGTLDYAPNVESVAYLANVWPRLQLRRPGTTLCLAGARPTEAVLQTAEHLGWTVEADFAEAADLYAGARIAVAPLTMASGMQIKVQDALAHGLAVVATAPALAGYPDDIPAVRVDSERAFVDACAALLEDDAELDRLASRGPAWVESTLGPHRHRWAVTDALSPVRGKCRGERPPC
jgi:GT2 family glycosyltransferase